MAASLRSSNGRYVIRPRGRAGFVMRPESRARILENMGRSTEETVSVSEYEADGEWVGLRWERGCGCGSGAPEGTGFRREESEIILACTTAQPP